MPNDHKKSICLIGAGPAGCSLLYHLARLAKEGTPIPEIVCYERQADVGGMWNYTWRTGVDEFGEPVHSSMYRALWANTSKEYLEFEDYRCDEHFGKKVPSYLPRKFVLDYMKGRWDKQEFRHWIRFHHLVHSVVYDEERGVFTVVAKDLINDRHLQPQVFTHVVVAVGHFSTPHVPKFPGMESFPRNVTHSHYIKHFVTFKGKRVLIVGNGFSGEDAAIQCVKYGAKSVILAWRSNALNFKWPVDERPNLTSVEGSRVNFKDGSSAEVDEIILCTGYRHHYPFMEDKLRINCENRSWTPDLYKGVLYLKGGDSKLYYLSTQQWEFSTAIGDQEAIWTIHSILGLRPLPTPEEMAADEAKWRQKWDACGVDRRAMYGVQTEHLFHLCDLNGEKRIDVTGIGEFWCETRKENALTYRDQPCASAFNGEVAPAPEVPFLEAFDPERVEGFLE